MSEPSTIAARLEDVFRLIWRGRMQGLPILNPSLRVEAVGVRPWESHWLCALVSPWSISLVLAPQSRLLADAPVLVGEKRLYDFPVGRLEFVAGVEEGLGRFEMCSLFSPVAQFGDHETARAAAQGALDQVFKVPSGEAGKKPEASASDKVAPATLSRRDLFRSAFSGAARDGDGEGAR